MAAFGGLLILTGCHSGANSRPAGVSVRDSGHLLTKAAVRQLRRRQPPSGMPVAVLTRDDLPAPALAGAADDAFATTAQRVGGQFADRGILFFVTGRPRLIQIRVGSAIYLDAQRAQVTWGPRYLRHQGYRPHRAAQRLTSDIPWATNTLRGFHRPWWERHAVVRTLDDSVGWTMREVLETAHPADGIYGNYILAPVLHVRLLELHVFGSYLGTFAMLGVVVLCIRAAVRRVVARIRRRLRGRARIAAAVLGIALGLVVSFVIETPAIASALLLAGARREDQMAVASTHLPGMRSDIFAPTAWTSGTSFRLALAVLAVRLLVGVSRNHLLLRCAAMPAAWQADAYRHLEDDSPVEVLLLDALTDQSAERSADPFTQAFLTLAWQNLKVAVTWGLIAVTLLPSALSFAAVGAWLPECVLGVVMSIRALRLAHVESRRG